MGRSLSFPLPSALDRPTAAARLPSLEPFDGLRRKQNRLVVVAVVIADAKTRGVCPISKTLNGGVSVTT